jgi:hypothetical protein
MTFPTNSKQQFMIIPCQFKNKRLLNRWIHITDFSLISILCVSHPGLYIEFLYSMKIITNSTLKWLMIPSTFLRKFFIMVQITHIFIILAADALVYHNFPHFFILLVYECLRLAILATTTSICIFVISSVYGRFLTKTACLYFNEKDIQIS